MERTLYRSRGDRMIAGVCGGIADYFDIDPTVVRLAVVLLALVTSGGIVLAYIVMAVVVPEEPLPGEEREAVMADEEMGPGDMPEPGEFGTPPMPDPAEGVAPSHEPPPRAQQPAAQQPAAQQPAMPPWQPEERPRRERRGGTTAGIILIVLGVVFLLQQFFSLDISRLWPLILIAIGIAIMFRRGR